MNGQQLIDFLADKLNLAGLPPTDSRIVNALASLDEAKLKSIIGSKSN